MFHTQDNRYPAIWRLMHWLSASVILWAIFSGFYILLAKPHAQVIHNIADLNVSLTLLFIPVFILRLVLIQFIKKPDTSELRSKDKALANKAHSLIYLVVSLVLVSGLLMMERSMWIFDWVEIPAVFTKGVITEGFFIIHRIANVVLTFLLMAHILAVVKHQLNGVPILRKMV